MGAHGDQGPEGSPGAKVRTTEVKDVFSGVTKFNGHIKESMGLFCKYIFHSFKG